MPTLNIVLDERTRDALREFARREVRDPRGQAIVIIRKELERQGYLSAEPQSQPARAVEGASNANGN
ncbi:MAG: hypothetical protein L0322_25345 [Chloroflexi bacterium]|nr:hypothetical protein [Chloroflexota bacterium]MCI0644948.1 hypothetical protein [Chloroflexota bacterium]